MNAAEAVQILQDLLRQVDRAGAGSAAAQQDRQQFSIAECPDPLLQQALTRAVIFRQVSNQKGWTIIRHGTILPVSACYNRNT